MLLYSLLLASLLWLALSVSAVPAFEGARGQFAINSLVSGASYIEAVGPVKDDHYRTTHLSLVYPGQPGNLSVIHNTRQPSLFYIHRTQLWLFVNETTVFPVNALNTTNKADFPLQLVVEKKRAGIKGGSWRWQGTLLYYDHWKGGNGGLYYSCTLPDGTSGVFMFLKASTPPKGCEATTMHSWNHDFITQRGKS